jgi:hypothetical protein
MAEDDARRAGGSRRSRVLFDAQGRVTDDADAAVSGEVVERSPTGVVLRRRKFFLERDHLPWLPVGEAAFLLWVLVGLVGVWVVVAVVLRIS